MLGTDRKDLTKLGTVPREIHVALLGPKPDAQFVYPATTLHSGLLPASDTAAGGISFAPRRFAYRPGQQLPMLHASGKVDAAVLNAAEYFVTMHLGESRLYDAPGGKTQGSFPGDRCWIPRPGMPSIRLTEQPPAAPILADRLGGAPQTMHDDM